MNKKEMIIQTARDLFTKFGYKKVSMDEIAREAKVTKKTIYSYFKDKDSMFLYFVDEELEKIKKELEKNYNPADIETRLYEKWQEKKYFHAEVDKDKKPFTIVMPPPNITGQLHMGHALDNTMQDILIRFKRMQGYSALWVPGTDHASIATEAKIVEAMRKEGIT